MAIIKTKQFGNFTTIGNAAIYDARLKASDKGVLLYLWSKPLNWEFCGRRIAKEFLDSQRVIYGSLKRLEELGYIMRVKRKDGKVDYHLYCQINDSLNRVQKPDQRFGNQPNQQIAETLTINKTDSYNKTDKENKTDSDPYSFEQFWSDYDKKVERKDCLRKWSKIKVSDKILIKDHIPKYKVSEPDKQYRKNPLTYLNKESWNDEIIAPTKSTDNQNTEVYAVNV